MSSEVRFESQGAYAALDIWDDNKTATLAALNATFKRRGSGTKVLELALEYADLKQLLVVLQVSPFGDDMGMDKAALRAYYMSYGFTWQGDGVMERKPAGPAEVIMEMRPWGDFTVSKLTEEEAASIVEIHGLRNAHFYIAKEIVND